MMKWTAALLGAALLGGCATTPEPCTPEWVEWKTEKVLTRFALANRGEVNRLRNFSEDLQSDNIGPLIALQVPGMIDDFKELAESFETNALPALNAAADQCGGIQTLAPAFTTFLRNEGVGEDVLEWVELITVLAIES